MREAAIEVVWRVQRRARVDQFPISDNLSALMALVMADLSGATERDTHEPDLPARHCTDRLDLAPVARLLHYIVPCTKVEP